MAVTKAKVTDFSYYNFFRSGYFKECVCAHKAHTLLDLEDAVTQDVQSVELDMLAKVENNLLETCIKEDGYHMSDIIFKK